MAGNQTRVDGISRTRKAVRSAGIIGSMLSTATEGISLDMVFPAQIDPRATESRSK